MISAIQRLTGDAERETVAEPGVETADGERLPAPADENDIGLARELVVEQLRDAESAFTAAWETDGDLHGSVDALTARHGWRVALTALEAYHADRAEAERLDFRVDSRTLTEAYEAVFAEPDVESIVYLSGLALDDGVRTINRVLEFEHEEQSAVRAVADRDSHMAVLDELERTGHRLLAHLHCHPGSGVAGTEPSETDMAYQRDLEALGYSAIGFVVTSDGFLRAYSSALDFDIAVHGEAITRHDRGNPGQHVFHLEDV